MPVYDYACDACGPFTVLRPMEEFREPCICPSCGASAPRAFLTAPALGMDSRRRRAVATNERSAHEPRSSVAHGAGCACCSGKSSRAATTASGGKSFPASRPWMISH